MAVWQAEQTCQQHYGGPGCEAIEILPQQIRTPTANLRRAEGGRNGHRLHRMVQKNFLLNRHDTLPAPVFYKRIPWNSILVF